MTRWRVWCPDRGQAVEDAWVHTPNYSYSHTWAAEVWAQTQSGFDGDPFTEIDVFVERCEHDSIWKERTKVRVEVRAEPVFEARIL